VSQWRRCKRRDFIRRLRKLGFGGLNAGIKIKVSPSERC